MIYQIKSLKSDFNAQDEANRSSLVATRRMRNAGAKRKVLRYKICKFISSKRVGGERRKREKEREREK